MAPDAMTQGSIKIAPLASRFVRVFSMSPFSRSKFKEGGMAGGGWLSDSPFKD
jgi:hypothetical protein